MKEFWHCEFAKIFRLSNSWEEFIFNKKQNDLSPTKSSHHHQVIYLKKINRFHRPLYFERLGNYNLIEILGLQQAISPSPKWCWEIVMNFWVIPIPEWQAGFLISRVSKKCDPESFLISNESELVREAWLPFRHEHLQRIDPYPEKSAWSQAKFIFPHKDCKFWIWSFSVQKF